MFRVGVGKSGGERLKTNPSLRRGLLVLASQDQVVERSLVGMAGNIPLHGMDQVPKCQASRSYLVGHRPVAWLALGRRVPLDGQMTAVRERLTGHIRIDGKSGTKSLRFCDPGVSKVSFVLYTSRPWVYILQDLISGKGSFEMVKTLSKRLIRGAMRGGLWLAACLVAIAQTNDLKPAYDFSLQREEKIKLAESAAPPEISGKATVYVLERTGYVKVREGTNGFSCFVDRQTPVNMEPTCFDAEGSATTLPTRLYAEEQRAQGKTEEQIHSAIEDGYKTGKFRAPGKPGIVYMMSDQIYLLVPSTQQIVHVPPHLMFYAPYATDKDIGSPPASASMPHLIRPGQPDAYIIVMPAPQSAHQ